MDNQVLKEQLEKMVDEAGFLTVVSALQDICFEKAEHLRSNWQDETSARFWEADGKRLNKILQAHV